MQSPLYIVCLNFCSLVINVYYIHRQVAIINIPKVCLYVAKGVKRLLFCFE